MDFLECVSGRRSIRKFKSEPIGDELIKKIVSVASYAPSWKNTQTTRYIVVENKELLKYFADHCTAGFEHNGKIIRGAAAVIIVTTIANRSGYERDGSFTTQKGTHWESFDAGIATQTLCLAAHNEGLGSVILGIYDEIKILERVKVPEDQKISALVAIGFPDVYPEMPKRKTTDDLLSII